MLLPCQLNHDQTFSLISTNINLKKFTRKEGVDDE